MTESKTYQKQFEPSDVAGVRTFSALLRSQDLEPTLIRAEKVGDKIRVQFEATTEQLEKLRTASGAKPSNGNEDSTRHEPPQRTGQELTKPTGIDLSGDLKHFAAAKNQTFSVNGAGSLELDLACAVGIVQGESNKISVQIDADPSDLKYFKVEQHGDTVSVRQSGGGSSGGNIVMGNIVGGNISIINNRVFIDGREVNAGQGSSASTKPPRVIISAPANVNLAADLSGTANLSSQVWHREARLDLAGVAKAAVAAETMRFDLSGSSNLRGIVQGGELRAGLSGASKANVNGSFSEVKAELSGAAKVQTEGTVNGDYRAEASGAGRIVHRGDVKGRVRRDRSGAASIDIG